MLFASFSSMLVYRSILQPTRANNIPMDIVRASFCFIIVPSRILIPVSWIPGMVRGGVRGARGLTESRLFLGTFPDNNQYNLPPLATGAASMRKRFENFITIIGF